eukprot:Rhum_TRINITY_DN15258_c8_g1::Rhum_TRINITY_DN15258_c8_g1_i1::g.148177::m.148177
MRKGGGVIPISKHSRDCSWWEEKRALFATLGLRTETVLLVSVLCMCEFVCVCVSVWFAVCYIYIRFGLCFGTQGTWFLGLVGTGETSWRLAAAQKQLTGLLRVVVSLPQCRHGLLPREAHRFQPLNHRLRRGRRGASCVRAGRVLHSTLQSGLPRCRRRRCGGLHLVVGARRGLCPATTGLVQTDGGEAVDHLLRRLPAAALHALVALRAALHGTVRAPADAAPLHLAAARRPASRRRRRGRLAADGGVRGGSAGARGVRTTARGAAAASHKFLLQVLGEILADLVGSLLQLSKIFLHRSAVLGPHEEVKPLVDDPVTLLVQQHLREAVTLLHAESKCGHLLRSERVELVSLCDALADQLFLRGRPQLRLVEQLLHRQRQRVGHVLLLDLQQEVHRHLPRGRVLHNVENDRQVEVREQV